MLRRSTVAPASTRALTHGSTPELLAASSRGVVKVWRRSATGFESLWETQNHFTALALRPDGEELAFPATDGKSCHVLIQETAGWVAGDVRASDAIELRCSVERHYVVSLTYSNGGDRLVIEGGQVQVGRALAEPAHPAEEPPQLLLLTEPPPGVARQDGNEQLSRLVKRRLPPARRAQRQAAVPLLAHREDAPLRLIKLGDDDALQRVRIRGL